MRSDVLDALGDQTRFDALLGIGGASADGGEELGHGGKVPTWKNVSSDEVVGLGVRFVAGFGHRDALEDCDTAVGFEQAIDAAEVGLEVFGPHSFEHFNGYDFVVFLGFGRDGQAAVVAEEDGDLIGKTCGTDAVFGELFLFFTEGQAGYSAACLFHRQHGETAPAGADFEDVVCGFDMGVFDEAGEFAVLSSLEAFLRGMRVGFGEPDGTAVCHVWAEEGGKHIVADVVVCGDVQFGVVESVSFPDQGTQVPHDLGGEGGAIGEVLSVNDEELEEFCQVWTADFPQHVGLCQAHVCEEGQSHPEEIVEDTEFSVGDCVDGLFIFDIASCSSRAAADCDAAIGVGEC